MQNMQCVLLDMDMQLQSTKVMKKLEHLLILNLEDKGSEAECLTAFKIAVAFAQKALEEPECHSVRNYHMWLSFPVSVS